MTTSAAWSSGMPPEKSILGSVRGGISNVTTQLAMLTAIVTAGTKAKAMHKAICSGVAPQALAKRMTAANTNPVNPKMPPRYNSVG